ncbi:helix-turn-helix transcriptional regulator, partial [Acidobacteria bacterium AH-259-G07]|nr:helix-turn-helix transcriptional regulator [Acidobacteria bacterium AH-259-G07]
MNGIISKKESLTGIIGLTRRKDAKPFAEEELSLLKILMPHLQRALQLHQRITSLQIQQKAASDALNRWSLGVILLDDKGQVLLMNRSAETIVNQKDGLSFDTNGLHAARSEQTLELHTLVHEAIQTSLGLGLHNGGGAFGFPRPSFKRPLNILVTPICENDNLFFQPGAAAAVFVSDPERTPEPHDELLTRLYGFTPAESRMALLLMQGKSVKEAAEELRITLNTARFHLKHIFDKTDTRR